MNMPQTPADWRDYLIARLDARWYGPGGWQVYEAYYQGDQNLALATRKFMDAYGGLFQALTDNWMPIVVNAPVERLRVQGFRFGGDASADQDAWDLWQQNNLDGESTQVHTEACKLGEAYWMIEPNVDKPKITAEHPSQVIVACAPGDRRTRLAAIKRWREFDLVYANVYLPDRVTKYRIAARDLITDPRENRRWETVGGSGNPLGDVPIVPVPNVPTMLGGGQSDLGGGITRLQDALNVLLAGLLIGAEYQAYPLRVLLGVEQPLGPDGRPIKSTELAVSQSRLLMFANENAKIAEFSEAKLEAFTGSMETLIAHLCAQSRTPPHYVMGTIVNASGDALKAAETGLVSKARAKMPAFSEAHEEALRLAFKSIDPQDDRATATDAETIWADPESRSVAETVDAAVKLSSIGVPQEALWERIGASPQEIDRWVTMKETQNLLAATTTELHVHEPQPPPPNGAQPQLPPGPLPVQPPPG